MKTIYSLKSLLSVRMPLFVFAITFCAYACTTPSIEPDPYAITTPQTGSRKELTLDSIFLYANQIYLWRSNLPSYEVFNPRGKYKNISPERTAYQRALYDLTQYGRNIAGAPYEWTPYEGHAKYSYLEDATSYNSSYSATSATTDTYITHRQYWPLPQGTVAYLYLSSFPTLVDVQHELDRVFADFTVRGITHLIIDLRHNAGGFVESAAYLADLIAPANLTGKKMFSEQFNEVVRAGKASLLTKQLYRDAQGNPVLFNGRLATMADVDYREDANTHYFSKKGTLNSIKHVSFLVSARTASASELLISCLKPYLPTTLIGQQTYGKPIGFFPIYIDQYCIYLSSFLLRNADGWSDYFQGLTVDIPTEEDESGIPIGSVQEPLLSAALKAIDPKLLKTAVFLPKADTLTVRTLQANVTVKTKFSLR